MIALLGILVCILFSAFFSGSEIAFSSLKEPRVRVKAEMGDKRARKILSILENFDSALSTILIGNNLVNIAASSITTVLINQLMGGRGTLVATIIMTVLILIFGEITPKILAKDNAASFSRISSGFLYLLMIILKPVNAVVNLILAFFNKLFPMPATHIPASEARLSSLIESGESEGIIDEEETDLMLSALEFPDIAGTEIQTPRVDLYAIDLDDPMPDIIEQALASPFSRIPVYQDTVDNIIGILHATNFLKVLAEKERISKEEFSSMLLEQIVINETMKLPKAFQILNQGNLQMAVIVDEYGGTSGCITMEDLLEELDGDIWDEGDIVEKEIQSLADHSYVVSADMSLRDFTDEFDLEYDDLDTDYNTVSGLILDRLGRFPEAGEELDIGELHLTVLSMEENKVDTVRVEKKEAGDGEL